MFQNYYRSKTWCDRNKTFLRYNVLLNPVSPWRSEWGRVSHALPYWCLMFEFNRRLYGGGVYTSQLFCLIGLLWSLASLDNLINPSRRSFVNKSHCFGLNRTVWRWQLALAGARGVISLLGDLFDIDMKFWKCNSKRERRAAAQGK